MSETLEQPSSAEAKRGLIPGSKGWTVNDLNQPEYEFVWEEEDYELVDGVIIPMAPAFYGGVGPTGRLISHLMKNSDQFREGMFFAEFDLLLKPDTVFRPDFVWLTASDEAAHRAQASQQGRGLLKSRLAIPPTLVVESISEGHEAHDRVLKFQRYAQFGVPNYWIIDGFENRMDCYVLEDANYSLQVGGTFNDVLRPQLFAPIEIPLSELWY